MNKALKIRKAGLTSFVAVLLILFLLPVVAVAQDDNPKRKGICWGASACRATMSECKAAGLLTMTSEQCIELGGDFQDLDDIAEQGPAQGGRENSK